MSRTAACAWLAGAALIPLLNAANAQGPCGATYRELSRVTPRAVLHEMSDTGSQYSHVIDDGAGCGSIAGPRIVAGEARLGGAVTLKARVLPITASAAVLEGLPHPSRSGGTWMGRGTNFFIRAAVALDVGPLHAVIAPEVWRAQNSAFDLFPSRNAERSSFASPWYDPPYSIDLPSRMGVDPLLEAGLGQSAIWLSVGAVEVGAAVSSQQWGPGRQGGLLLGADAAGIPRVFLRAHPMATRVGAWSFTTFAGSLTESRFFDDDRSNDERSLRAVNVAWSPRRGSAFSAGVSHASMLGNRSLAPEGPPNDASDQINALFAELRGAGTRAYAEVARAGQLPSLRDFVTVPYAGIAYLIGVEHSVTHSAGTLLISGEGANLEQPTDVREERTYDFYTSRSIPQGWTHRGRVLGHHAGPGGSHASLAIDWVAPRWSVGFFGDRTRWNEDAFHREYLARAPRHDVSVRAGVRGGYLIGLHELSLELSTGKRLNYLFQNSKFFTGYRTVDIAIPQLRLAITPRL